jgi:hypothetical protein
MSWNELMDILWVMFQVKWNYDSATNTINVEHISWFAPAAGIDLRNQLMAVASNKYSYLKESMPKYEKFSWREVNTIEFIGLPIWYDSLCVNQDPKTNTTESVIPVTTELEHIVNNPEAISDEGFVIFCNYVDGGINYVKTGCSPIGGIMLNMDLSFGNLHNCFYRHYRILISGYLNNIYETFWSAQKTKIQECSIILCDEFDPSEEITTELGETYLDGVKATVGKAELTPDNKIKLELLYGPDDNINTGVTEDKGIYVYQGNTCTQLTATLTDPADVGDLVILVREKVYDATNALICTGDWETWTIPAGDYTSTFNFDTFCSPQLAGYYCIIYFDFTGCPGWRYAENMNGSCTWLPT